jgi:hypothetical protein
MRLTAGTAGVSATAMAVALTVARGDQTLTTGVRLGELPGR